MTALKAISPTLEELRQLIGSSQLQEREILNFSLLVSGFPKGAVVEIVGSGKTEFITRFLAEHKSFRVAWIEPELTIYPFGFLQRGVDLSKILFVESDRESIWSALQVIQAQIFQVVTISSSHFDDRALRKIQLAAEKAQTLVVLLNEESVKSWVPSMQLYIERQQEDFRVHTLRRRV